MPAAGPRLGLRENLDQFSLLVLVNAFVGAMVGLERSVLPLVAEHQFGVTSYTVVLAFVASFGFAKAIANGLAGAASDRVGRKQVLIAGWIFALPVPVLLYWAPTWGWVLVANVLLGLNQGLAWSATVVMKIDLVGPRDRGLAMGLNEAAGYLAVAAAALGAGYVASTSGVGPEPFLLGIAFALAGLALSVFAVRETSGHAELESLLGGSSEQHPGLWEVIRRTSWADRNLSAVSLAGLVNNLNDGLAWGLFPLLFASAGLDLKHIAVLVALYPAVWGIAQLGTGWLSDHLGRKPLVVGGMLLQALALGGLAGAESFGPLAVASVGLGLGTAMVYPTFLAIIGDVAEPAWRASAVGVYRFWRDSGYVVGAVVAGLTADAFGIRGAVWTIALLTLGAGVLTMVRLGETTQSRTTTLREQTTLERS
jgi:MFS family permease